MRHRLAPSERAASTYSDSRTERIEPRSSRAMVAQPKIASARITGVMPCPTTVMMTIAPTRIGNAKKMSQIRMISESQKRPK